MQNALFLAVLIVLPLPVPIYAENSDQEPAAERKVPADPRFAFDLEDIEETRLLTRWHDGRWELAAEYELQRAFWIRSGQSFGVMTKLGEEESLSELWVTAWLDGHVIVDSPLETRPMHNAFMPLGRAIDKDRSLIRFRLQRMDGNVIEDRNFWMVLDSSIPDVSADAFEVISGLYEVPVSSRSNEFRLQLDGYLQVRSTDTRSGLRRLDCLMKQGSRHTDLWGYPNDDGSLSLRVPIAIAGDFTVTCRATDRVGNTSDEVMFFVLFDPPEPAWLDEE
jgi:hypothetical protein